MTILCPTTSNFNLEWPSPAASRTSSVHVVLTPNAYASSSPQTPRAAATDDPPRPSRIRPSTVASARVDRERTVDRGSARPRAYPTARVLDAGAPHAVAREKQQHQRPTIPNAAYAITQVRWTPASRCHDRITADRKRSTCSSHPGAEPEDTAAVLAARLAVSPFDISLERRETLRGRVRTCAIQPVSLTQIHMEVTVTRVIPLLSNTGTVAIPFEAWEPIIRAVQEDFEGEIFLHHHDAPGAYHNRRAVPTPHYLLEIVIDARWIGDYTQTVAPLIDEIVAWHTHKPAFPAEN